MNPDFSHLSVAERIQLVEDLWDSIAANPDDVPIPAWQIEELERRKANRLQNPQPGATWDEVQERIRNRRGQ